ncbi:MAG: alpha-galactosidase [Alphaproteobacteria bacterium]|nr:alpha-galactosidase [Alphaproteobacteria bacterium]
MAARALRLLSLGLLLAACAPPDEAKDGADTDVTGRTPLRAGDVRVDVDPASGRLSVVRADGVTILDGARASVRLGDVGDAGRDVRLGEGPLELTSVERAGPLGPARWWVVDQPATADAPRLTWEIGAVDEGPWTGMVLLRLTAAQEGQEPVTIARLAPLEVLDGDGALYVGDHPSTTRILDNGAFTGFDYVARLVPGDIEDEGWARLVPGNYRGNWSSNWNHAIVDVAGTEAWVAGQLSFELEIGVLGTSFDGPRSTPVDGREGFTTFVLEQAMLPHPKVVGPGEALASDWFVLLPDPPSGQEGLERYADAVAEANGIQTWMERGQPVPNGWNSWSGSGSTGGYGTDVNEEIVLANLEVMRRELRDWGIDWFQLDDGYEPAYGDWLTWRSDRFPHGPRWLSDRFREAGFRPGLWQAPFTPDPDALLVADHPEWVAGRDGIGAILATEYALLDLTDPEVISWIRELTRTVREDWGFEWYKLDFGYWAMFATQVSDPSLTRVESWRSAMRAVHEGLGDDAFLLGVGAMGANYGIADANRLTLDAMPVWDKQPQDPASPISQQGLKPTLRTAGRRYYLHGRIWVNHPDLILFRSNTRDPSWPRLTFEESRAFATWVGMAGGIVKLGDRLVDLEPRAIDVVRRLLPAWPGPGARPLDLFTREFPEVWVQHLAPEGEGAPAPYTVVGLFHWGANTDLGATPAARIPDTSAPRSFDLSLDALGVEGPVDVYELWTQRWLGRVDDRLQVEVPSHDSRVLALRPAVEGPAFLGWNRTLRMGGQDVTVDLATDALTFGADVVAPGEGVPFTYDLALRVPVDLAVGTPEVQGVEVASTEVTRDGEEVHLALSFTTSGRLALRVPFVR